MSRQCYLVTYDIADPKRLRQVFKAMKNFGDHLQLSVFLCELNARERVQMEAALSRIIHNRQDQVLIVNLGPARSETLDKIQSLGQAYVPAPRVFIA